VRYGAPVRTKRGRRWVGLVHRRKGRKHRIVFQRAHSFCTCPEPSLASSYRPRELPSVKKRRNNQEKVSFPLLPSSFSSLLHDLPAPRSRLRNPSLPLDTLQQRLEFVTRPSLVARRQHRQGRMDPGDGKGAEVGELLGERLVSERRRKTREEQEETGGRKEMGGKKERRTIPCTNCQNTLISFNLSSSTLCTACCSSSTICCSAPAPSPASPPSPVGGAPSLFSSSTNLHTSPSASSGEIGGVEEARREVISVGESWRTTERFDQK
jgi:hypothetical protein